MTCPDIPNNSNVRVARNQSRYSALQLTAFTGFARYAAGLYLPCQSNYRCAKTLVLTDAFAFATAPDFASIAVVHYETNRNHLRLWPSSAFGGDRISIRY
jgi:hypothetical protein